jgi:hypothetical protein
VLPVPCRLQYIPECCYQQHGRTIEQTCSSAVQCPSRPASGSRAKSCAHKHAIQTLCMESYSSNMLYTSLYIEQQLDCMFSP